MVLTNAVGFLLRAGALAVPEDYILNPRDYALIAEDVEISSGTWTIDTRSSESAPLISNGPTTYTGQWVTVSNVMLGAFVFESLAITGGAWSTVSGSDCGLALLAQGDITIGVPLDVSGTKGGAYTSIGKGGPGAEGGVAATSYSSSPPGPERGDGGQGTTSGVADDGTGYGAGSGGVYNEAGGGGGYGGVGGVGAVRGGGLGAAGGTNYGDAPITVPYGGSGGGGGCRGHGSQCGGGGGGRIAFYSQDNFGGIPTGISVTGGAGGVSADGGDSHGWPGIDGTFYDGPVAKFTLPAGTVVTIF